MSRLAEIVCSGLTSFEFVNSGLLESISKLLATSDFISDDPNGLQITKEKAQTFVLKFKMFVDVMVKKIDGKLPFRYLFDLCHEQLTLAEPIIFKENRVDQSNPASKSVVINLVYDIDGSKCGQVIEEHKEKSEIYIKRSKLFESLKEFPIPIRITECIQTLEEFLLKRVKTQQDVQSMLNQASRHIGFLQKKQPSNYDDDQIGLSNELAPLYHKLIEKLADYLDECVDRDYFIDNRASVVTELVQIVSEWETTNAYLPEQFWKYLSVNITQLIDKISKVDFGDVDDNDIPDEEKELIQEEIQVKSEAFLQLIQSVKAQSFNWSNFQKLDKSSQVAQLPENQFESIELLETENCSSHQHQLIKHPEGHHTSWNCDRVMGSLVCRSGYKKGIQGWRCNQCDFDLCINCMKINKYFDQKTQPHSQQIVEDQVSIQDLLKQGQEDVELDFYFDGKLIEKDTNFTQIFKQVQDEENEFQSVMEQLVTGGKHEFRNIYFIIRQKKNTILPKTIEPTVATDIPKIKTEVSSVTHLVKTMIDSITVPFLINQKDSPVKCSTLENTLKVLKVLWYIYNNSNQFMSSDIQLATGIDLDESIDTVNQDFQIANLQKEFPVSQFHHAKLDNNLQKVITDFNKLNYGASVNTVLSLIFNTCSFLFTFDTKILYLKLINLFKIDPNRAMLFMKHYAVRQGKQLNPAQNVKPIERQKIVVERNISFVQQTFKELANLKKRSIVEFVYKDEEGTGLGPTLEFYSLLGKELRGDQSLWRNNTSDSMLYPKSYHPTSAQLKLKCEQFELAGIIVGRSILDDRLVDLPLSPLMWDLVFQKNYTLQTLKKLDKNLFKLLSDFQLMANKKHKIDQIQNLDQETKQVLYSNIKSHQDASIDDFDLTFYNPVDENVELVQNGCNVAVSIQNLQQYIDLVVYSTFDESVQLQVQAFTKGLNSIIPLAFLQSFESSGEIELLVCGQSSLDQSNEEWNDVNRLSELINTAHGFNPNSKAFKYFLRYISEIKPTDRQCFVQFITGSPRLPMGGFGQLDPRITVVLKRPTYVQDAKDEILPSVMTCQNYIKMPDYSSYEVLKAKFDYAIEEGSLGFSLS